jgi:hypothetical protein
MRIVGLDAEAVFDHPDIVAWRKLPDRENCTLDANIDGKKTRLHIKRYLVPSTAATDEVKAIELLRDAGIPTVPLVGHGHLADGRSFVITEDLAGYRDAEKMVAAGTPPLRIKRSIPSSSPPSSSARYRAWCRAGATLSNLPSYR